MSVRPPPQLADAALVRELMNDFATATGLDGGGPSRRYLWTDAFAVGNFLGLHRATGEARWLDLALALVAQVHRILGGHRPDDTRRGRLSGLSASEAEQHPTIGGLRIGKPLPERAVDEPFDERLEWDRDGQYFHYLTQWMHALRRVAEELRQEHFHRWAVELARTAQARFKVTEPHGGQHMIWKASVDLSRPLVASMGQHDPLDGWLSYLELTFGGWRAEWHRPGLAVPIAEADRLCDPTRWVTDDPLAAGALLHACFRLLRLVVRHEVEDHGRLDALFAAADASLEACARQAVWGLPAEVRLAFRELGLAFGLHAVERASAQPVLARRGGRPLARLARQLPLARRIDRFWGDPKHRAGSAWLEHREINGVMLATSLAPDGYLGPA